MQNARKFVTDEKVDSIFGSAATPVAIPMADVAAESGTVQLAASPIGLPTGKNAWSFRLPQSNDVMAHAVVGLMKKQGVKRHRAALKLVAASPDAILVEASGSGAARPENAIIELGFKGKVYQIHAAATEDLMHIGGKDVEGTLVVSGPAAVGDLLPDSPPSKKLAQDFVAKYDKAYGAGTANPFAGHAYDALTVLEKGVPVALKTAKPGTKEFRAALKDAIKNMGRTVFAHGIMNWTATDHWGYTMETGVMLVVKNGDRALAN